MTLIGNLFSADNCDLVTQTAAAEQLLLRVYRVRSTISLKMSVVSLKLAPSWPYIEPSIYVELKLGSRRYVCLPREHTI